MPSVSRRGVTHLGLDVHKDSISVAVLEPEREGAEVDRIFNDEYSVRHLIARFPEPHDLRVCYEAGPTGYDLQRLLTSLGVPCDVVAPSLIPKAPGDRVKTDRRDARRLARLHRAGELVAIRVPTIEEEAMRDLCRARGDMVEDRTRARHRLSKFLLRHGHVYRDGKAWTARHEQWLLAQRFSDRALASTYDHYRGVLIARDAQIAAIEADLTPYFTADPFGEQVRRLAAYRGVTEMGALTLASEVCDWRRFARGSQFMGFCGLVPSEHSSGSSTRRGHITKAGNTHLRFQLVESAWAYQHRPGVGTQIRKRQDGLPPEVVARAWTAQLRLCGRFRRLAARKTSKNVVVTAVARELAGFLWAEMTA
ncbi:MAG TPA: IS110 family transposase [Actinomycetota bacterium]|nr:IS110 family transposase [Actinomycetota bacterium]